MPKSLLSPGTKSKRRQDKPRVSLEEVQSQSISEPPAKRFKPLAPGTQAAHDFAVRTFDEFVGAPRNVVHQGVPVSSLKCWIARGSGFPPPEIMQPFLTFWFGNARSRGSKPLSSAPGEFLAKFTTAYHRLSGEIVSSTDRQPSSDWCTHLVSEQSLPDPLYQKAQLSRDSLAALQEQVMSPAFTLVVFVYRLAIMIFIALASQTGLRPGSILADGGETAKRMGARYGYFDLYALRNATPGAPNHIIGYYTPRWGKTATTRGKSFPLVSTPHPRCSAQILVLMKLRMDGGMTDEELKNVFDPRFIERGEKVRQIWINPQWQDTLVFRLTNGSPMRTHWMSLKLQKLSILCGFERLVGANTFRHMGAQAMAAAELSMEAIQNQLTHMLKSKSTKSYMGNHLLFEIPMQLAGVKENQSLRLKALTANAIPDKRVPRSLTAHQKAEAHESKRVQDAMADCSEIEAEMSAIGGHDPKLEKELTSAKNHLIYSRRAAEADKLDQLRKAFFATDRSATPSFKGPSNEVSSLSSIEGSNTPPSEDEDPPLPLADVLANCTDPRQLVESVIQLLASRAISRKGRLKRSRPVKVEAGENMAESTDALGGDADEDEDEDEDEAEDEDEKEHGDIHGGEDESSDEDSDEDAERQSAENDD